MNYLCLLLPLFGIFCFKPLDTPKSALAQPCNYALERWDGLCRYCDV